MLFPSYTSKKTVIKINLNPGKDTGKAEILHTIGGNVNIIVTMEIHMAILLNPKNRTAYNLVILLPGIYQRIQPSAAAFSTIAKTRNEPRCPSR